MRRRRPWRWSEPPARFTVTVAFAVLPAPSFEVTDTELFLMPAVVPVTLALNVQEVLAARVAPDNEIEVAFAAAVIVPPPQDPASALGVATTRPTGSVSVNAISVFEIPALALVTVMSTRWCR